ncbi:MAG: hypothetical protein ACRD1B_07950, partial [Thermoanaerobaculia bacterium]
MTFRIGLQQRAAQIIDQIELELAELGHLIADLPEPSVAGHPRSHFGFLRGRNVHLTHLAVVGGC